MAEWRHRSACKVAPDLFHPERGNRGTAGLALHICLSHCEVRSECRADADANPPTEPQVLAGRRYVAKGCRAAEISRHPTLPSKAGCVLCAKEES